MAGSEKVTENTGSFIACAALEFPVASKSIVAQSFPSRNQGKAPPICRVSSAPSAAFLGDLSVLRFLLSEVSQYPKFENPSRTKANEEEHHPARILGLPPLDATTPGRDLLPSRPADVCGCHGSVLRRA